MMSPLLIEIASEKMNRALSEAQALAPPASGPLVGLSRWIRSLTPARRLSSMSPPVAPTSPLREPAYRT